MPGITGKVPACPLVIKLFRDVIDAKYHRKGASVSPGYKTFRDAIYAKYYK